jgi:predicted DNA-binding transcriptional regulator AlpA
MRADDRSGKVTLPRLCRADDVAAWLQLESRKAVYTMVERGEIPARCVVRIGPRRLRFIVDELNTWFDEQKDRAA